MGRDAYTLVFGGLLLLGGRSGDLLGRRRIFIAGVLVFALASLAGGFATGQAWLLAARAMQGVSEAIAAPTALSLVAVTFPEGPPRNRAFGVYAAMSIAGLAVGLIAGGLPDVLIRRLIGILAIAIGARYLWSGLR
jgi:MFS family permease